MEKYTEKIKVKTKIFNIIILFIIYGWLIFNNILKLMNTDLSLYKYVLISSPFFIIVGLVSFNKNLNIENLLMMFLYMLMPVYIIFLDCINGNYSHRLSYDLYMIYIFIFINIIMFIVSKKVNIDLINRMLKIISGSFIIISFIVLLYNGVSLDKRFLNTNFTSFFICQFIIIVICQERRKLYDWIISLIAIVELLAASGRASIIVLIFIIFLKSSRNLKKSIIFIIISICLFFSMKSIYYNYLKVNTDMVYISRPIGFIVGDMDVVLDQSSNERIVILSEYSKSMINKIPLSILFGLGPKNFKEYSHNILVDSISFGGIYTLTINFIVFFRTIKLKKYNECLYYQIMFFFLCMMFTGTFITNITYWGLVFLQQYKYYSN